MTDVYALFGGEATPEDVIAAGEASGTHCASDIALFESPLSRPFLFYPLFSLVCGV